jgi:hypothetical protein
MSECEAAAAIIKCGIDTDAEVTKRLITTYSLQPDMASLIFHPKLIEIICILSTAGSISIENKSANLPQL